MSRLLIVVVISTLFFATCGEKKQDLGEDTFPDLTGTRWEAPNDVGLTHFTIFDKEPVEWYDLNTDTHTYRDKKGSFASYVPELGRYMIGTYAVVGDTLFMREIDWESNLPGTTKKEITAYNKCVFTDNGLKVVYSIRKYGQTWEGGPIENGIVWKKRVDWAD
ncbi:MAG: hypothetical protein F4207_10920 [Gemmatimonadetes bacterium]|nr:hypothetical protein [Gemmatimonadota bacterium]MYG16916.1 hypothetical protein [Gemmatimonadota bacterium]